MLTRAMGMAGRAVVLAIAMVLVMSGTAAAQQWGKSLQERQLEVLRPEAEDRTDQVGHGEEAEVLVEVGVERCRYRPRNVPGNEVDRLLLTSIPLTRSCIDDRGVRGSS